MYRSGNPLSDSLVFAVQMLAQYRAVVRYVIAETRLHGQGSEQAIQGKATQLQQLVQLFSTSTPDRNDATDLLLELADDDKTHVFDADERKKIATIVSTRIRTDSGPKSHCTKGQLFFYPENYLEEKRWSMYLSKDYSMNDKMDDMVEFLLEKGCVWAKEKTCVACVGLLSVCQKRSHGIKHSPAQTYQLVLDFKNFLEAKRQSGGHNVTMRVFPENVADFLMLHAACYIEGHPPVECRVSRKELAHAKTKHQTPARSNNRLLRDASAVSNRQREERGAATDPLLAAVVNAMSRGFVDPYVPPRRKDPRTVPNIEEVESAEEEEVRGAGVLARRDAIADRPAADIADAMEARTRMAGTVELKSRSSNSKGGVALTNVDRMLDRVEAAVDGNRSKATAAAKAASKKAAGEKQAKGKAKGRKGKKPAMIEDDVDDEGEEVGRELLKRKAKIFEAEEDDDEEDAEEDDEEEEARQTPRALKRPSARIAAKRPAAKEASKSLTKPGFPANSKERPSPQKEPMHWRGGRIYCDLKNARLRCYRRVGDRIEKQKGFDPNSRKSFKEAWNACLGMIVEDERPVQIE